MHRPYRVARIVTLLLTLAVGASAVAGEIAKDLAGEYAAAFVSQTVPSSIQIGAVTAVSITMRNTGTRHGARGRRRLPRNAATAGQLLLVHPGQPIRQPQRQSCAAARRRAPGRRCDVHVQRQAARRADSRRTPPFRFRMLSQTHGTFGEETPDPGVGVTTAAEFVAQQVPARVASSGATCSWRSRSRTPPTRRGQPAGYTLASAGPPANTTWGVKSVPLRGTRSRPVTRRSSASSSRRRPRAGTYNFQWQMTGPAGAPFGGVSPATPVAGRHARPTPTTRGSGGPARPASESGWGINFAHQGDGDLRHMVHVRRAAASRCGCR